MKRDLCAKSKGWRGLLVAALATGMMGMAVGVRGQSSLPEGKGKDVVERACTVCHGTSNFTGSRLSKSDWEYVVNDMVDRGALITDAEKEIIIEYLVEHFGPKESSGQSATGK